MTGELVPLKQGHQEQDSLKTKAAAAEAMGETKTRGEGKS